MAEHWRGTFRDLWGFQVTESTLGEGGGAVCVRKGEGREGEGGEVVYVRSEEGRMQVGGKRMGVGGGG